MTASKTLLCIHRDPSQLDVLRDNGYELITATNGCDGLRIFASRPIDGIVIEYYLAFLNGAVVAGEIKRIRPAVPIVMVTEHLELPDGALKSVDALVVKSDGSAFLLAVVHFWLNIKPGQHDLGATRTRKLHRSKLRDVVASPQANHFPSSDDRTDADAAFTPEIWHDIRNGIIQF
jgi:DNA-binding response OmpR family regulator